MRLFEFAQDDPLRVKLTAVASQLESRFKNQNQPLPLDFFLDILSYLYLVKVQFFF
jgi:hypothetical protein